MKTHLIAVIAGASLLAGCAVPEDAGFEDVRRMAGERSDARLHWNRGTEQDREAEKLVADLLSRELTPESAVQIALLNNPALQAEYEDLGVAQADLVQAGLLKNPVFLAGARFSRRSGVATGYEFEIVQEFLDLLIFPARKELAGREFERTKLRVADAVVETAARAKEAWFAYVAAQQIAGVQRLVAAAADASSELARRLKEAGNLSELAAARERDLAETARRAWARAELDAAAARERLTVILGVWGEQAAWTAPGKLPDIPDLEPPLDRLESLAVARRLDLAAALRDRDASKARLDLVKAFRWLGIVEIGYGAERETERASGWLHGPTIALTLPLFDRQQATIFALEAELRRRESLNRDLAVRIRSEVRSSRLQFVELRRLALHQRAVVVPLRERIVTLALREYNFMLIGVGEVLRARQDGYDAYRESVELVRDYWIARTGLERAVGGRLPETSR